MSNQYEQTSQVLRYYGGKGSRLAKWIIGYMPPHDAYIEPFCGGASVFFNKSLAKVNVLNDTNGELINFFRVMRERPDELAYQVEMTAWARGEFETAWNDDENLSDVEMARRLVVKAWQGFGNHIARKAGWNRKFTSYGGKWSVASHNLLGLAHKLKEARIENKNALDILDSYGTPLKNELFDRVFYLDPPYTHDAILSKHGYGENDIDHEALLTRIQTIDYDVMISGYSNELYEDMLTGNGWQKETLAKNDHVGNKATECLWLNPMCASKQSKQLKLF